MYSVHGRAAKAQLVYPHPKCPSRDQRTWTGRP